MRKWAKTFLNSECENEQNNHCLFEKLCGYHKLQKLQTEWTNHALLAQRWRYANYDKYSSWAMSRQLNGLAASYKRMFRFLRMRGIVRHAFRNEPPPLTLPKPVSDDSRHFIFRRRKQFFFENFSKTSRQKSKNLAKTFEKFFRKLGVKIWVLLRTDAAADRYLDERFNLRVPRISTRGSTSDWAV